MFVGGEAGAGKTALLARFRSLVGDAAELIVGRCDASGAGLRGRASGGPGDAGAAGPRRAADRLGATAREALEAAAVIGPRSQPWLLEHTLGGGVASLRDCLAAGLLVSAGSGVAFGHELVRETVLDAILPHRRLELHRRGLVALLAAPPATHDAARLAHHAEAAADLPAVLEHTGRAALRASELGAHREAADQHARLLRFGDGLPAADRVALPTRHAAECAVADRPEDAIRSYEEAAGIAQAIGDVRTEAEATGRLAACLVVSGRNAQAEAQA